MSTMHEIPKLRDYCGDGNPVIAQTFYPAGGGWVTTFFRKRASRRWLRKLREEGATQVSVEVAPDRVADFSIDELLRGPNG